MFAEKNNETIGKPIGLNGKATKPEENQTCCRERQRHLRKTNMFAEKANETSGKQLF